MLKKRETKLYKTAQFFHRRFSTVFTSVKLAQTESTPPPRHTHLGRPEVRDDVVQPLVGEPRAVQGAGQGNHGRGQPRRARWERSPGAGHLRRTWSGVEFWRPRGRGWPAPEGGLKIPRKKTLRGSSLQRRVNGDRGEG